MIPALPYIPVALFSLDGTGRSVIGIFSHDDLARPSALPVFSVQHYAGAIVTRLRIAPRVKSEGMSAIIIPMATTAPPEAMS